MAVFYLNQASEESGHSQWQRYLQNKSYIDSLSHSLNESIRAASAEQAVVMQESADMISDMFRESMDEHNEQIKKSSSYLANRIEKLQLYVQETGQEIAQFKNLFDWRSALLIEEMRINNMLSTNIASMLRIPDSQKERQYYIERGLHFFRNAKLDVDLYQDALEYFHKAEAVERTDYFTLFYIGKIYLYAENCINIDLAEKYLYTAGKYAYIESESSSQSVERESIKTIAVESYFNASIACYIQGKFEDAAHYAKKSYEISSDFLESGYSYAKSLCALNDEQLAVPILDDIVQREPGYVSKIVEDPDIITKPTVLTFIAQLKDTAVKKAEERLLTCLSNISNVRYKDIAREMNELLELLKKNDTYDTAMNILAKLDEIKKFKYDKVRISGLKDNILHFHCAVNQPDKFRLAVRGNYAAFKSDSNHLTIVNYECGKEIVVINIGEDPIFDVAFHPSLKKIAVATESDVQIWDFDQDTATVSHTVDSTIPMPIWSLTPHEKNLYLRKASIIFYITDWEGNCEIKCESQLSSSYDISHDGRYIADTNHDNDNYYKNTLRIHSIEEDTDHIIEYELNNAGLFHIFKSIYFTYDSRFIAVHGDDFALLWDCKTGKPVELKTEVINFYNRLSFREDSKGMCQLVDITNKEKHYKFKAEKNSVKYIPEKRCLLMNAEGLLIKRNFRYEITEAELDSSTWDFAQYSQMNKPFLSFIKNEIANHEQVDLEDQRLEAQLMIEEKKRLIDEENRRLDKERLERIKQLKEKIIYYYQLGLDEERQVDKQWFGKNYGTALWYYEKSYEYFAKIGDYEEDDLDLLVKNLREAISRVKNKAR